MLNNDEYNALCVFKSPQVVSDVNDKYFIHFKEQGYIVEHEHETSLTDCYGTMNIQIAAKSWGISYAGNKALQEFDNKLRDAAEQKADKRKEHIFQIFLVLLAYTLGIVTEYFSGIVGVIYGLFH